MNYNNLSNKKQRLQIMLPTITGAILGGNDTIIQSSKGKKKKMNIKREKKLEKKLKPNNELG